MSRTVARRPRLRTSNSEASVLRACLHLLGIRGVKAWRCNTGAAKNPAGRLVRYGTKGASDIQGLIPWCKGRFIAVETKRPASPGRAGGKLSLSQWQFLDAVRRAGGVALVVDSVVTLSTALDRLGYEPGAVFDLPDRPAENPVVAPRRRRTAR